jgi:hypothetical protein
MCGVYLLFNFIKGKNGSDVMLYSNNRKVSTKIDMVTVSLGDIRLGKIVKRNLLTAKAIIVISILFARIPAFSDSFTADVTNEVSFGCLSDRYSNQLFRTQGMLSSDESALFSDKLQVMISRSNSKKFALTSGFEFKRNEESYQILSLQLGFILRESTPSTNYYKEWFACNQNKDILFNNKSFRTLGGGIESEWEGIRGLLEFSSVASESKKEKANKSFLSENIAALSLGYMPVCPFFVRFYLRENYNTTHSENIQITYHRFFSFYHAEYRNEYFELSAGYAYYSRAFYNNDSGTKKTVNKDTYSGGGLTFNLKKVISFLSISGEVHILKGTKGTSDNLFMGKLGTKVSF